MKKNVMWMAIALMIATMMADRCHFLYRTVYGGLKQ
jgi:hypothetical protein